MPARSATPTHMAFGEARGVTASQIRERVSSIHEVRHLTVELAPA
ncbi:hypothetical protein [Bordetella bronchiseptica]|nr:hypothetical protein [Bordetella bronchiseptica]KDD86930.1 hypothetical protein L531_0017 [Bordetella bronchiseptica MO275]